MPASDAYNPVDRPVWMTGPPQAPAPYQDTIPGGPVGTLPSPGQTPPPGLPPGPQYQPPDYGAQAQAEYLKRAALADAQGPEGFGGLPPGLEGLQRPQKPLGMSTGAASALLGAPPGQSLGGGRYPPTGPPQPPPDYAPNKLRTAPWGQDANSPDPLTAQLQAVEAAAGQPLGPGNWIERLSWGLAGAGVGGDQENPYHKAQREARDLKLKNQLEVLRLKDQIEQRREAKEDKFGNMAMDLVKAGGPAAALGAPMLGQYLKKIGYEVSPEILSALGKETLSFEDIGKIQKAKVFGVSVQDVQSMYPNQPKETVARLYNQPLNDDAAGFLGIPTATQRQMDKLKLQEEIEKQAAAEVRRKYPEMDVNALVPYLEKNALKKYHKDYTELDPAQRTEILDMSATMMDEDKLKHATAMRQDIVGASVDNAPAGGTYHDRLTGLNFPLATGEQRKQVMPDGSGRWVKLDANDLRTTHLMTRGLASVVWLKRHMGEVLASVAGKEDVLKNISKALENKSSSFAGASRQVSAFLGHVLNAAFEEARAAGGGQTLRIQILKAIQKDITPSLFDSQQQALEKLDIMAVNMTNVIRQNYGDPDIKGGFERKMGPGKYEALDTRTGKTVPITIPEGQWSQEYYQIKGPQ